MKLYDKIIGGSLAAVLTAYYTNKYVHRFTDYIGLEGEPYDWTMGGLPEFLAGAVGARALEGLAGKLGVDSPWFRRLLGAGTALAAGTLEEIATRGWPIEDGKDIVLYGAGAVLSTVVSYAMERRERAAEPEAAGPR